MREGELWWFDNKQVHEAFNDAQAERIHLIFDLLPREAANVALDLDAKLRLEKPLSEAPETDNPMEVGEVESFRRVVYDPASPRAGWLVAGDGRKTQRAVPLACTLPRSRMAR